MIAGRARAHRPAPIGHFEQLFECDARRGAIARSRSRGSGAAASMSWVLAFAGFAALIILHEAGHFIAAKAVGMRVERFFLFFPPKVW